MGKGYKREAINYVGIMHRIPDIMSLDLVRKGDNWEGRYYIDGKRHPYRRNKLQVKMWKRADGTDIMVYEQGGEVMSLQRWLVQYGGAIDSKTAWSIMKGNSIPIREFMHHNIIENVEGLYIPEEVYNEYRQYPFENCNLYNYFCRLFGENKTKEAFERYNVTTNERGDVVFWFRNNEGKLCHDKIVRYKHDGHRDKGFGGSRRFKTSDGYTQRCMFGSHLIESDDEIVRIVESEKTALACYCAFGDLWLATGGKGQLRDTDERTILYPDMDAICEWREKGNVEEWWINAGVELGEKDDMCDMIEKKINNGSLKV